MDTTGKDGLSVSQYKLVNGSKHTFKMRVHDSQALEMELQKNVANLSTKIKGDYVSDASNTLPWWCNYL